VKLLDFFGDFCQLPIAAKKNFAKSDRFLSYAFLHLTVYYKTSLCCGNFPAHRSSILVCFLFVFPV
jgi:hypothetical protein